MALPKLFQRIFFHNNTTPAINEDNLNAMSKAIDDLDNRVIVLGDDVITVIPQIQAYLEQAEDLVEAMELLSENPPYIGQNGNWWVWDTNTSTFVDSGVDASISVNIADITMLAPDAAPYVTNSGTDTDPIFHLFIPRGQTGNGISTIAKTGTSGLVDTYTITMTDGTTSTFTVTNGAGDMNKSVYDPTNAIANAGGMKSAAAKNSTNAVTANSTDLVESGAVYNANKGIYEVMGQNGAKNLFNPDANTQTYKNVTYTKNSDKTYSTTGTANANGGIFFGEFLAKANVLYTLSGCPSGGSDSSYCFVVRTVKSETGAVLSYQGHNVLDVGSGADFAVNADTTLYIQIRIENGYDTSGMVFKPMIRDARDTDPTYQPFAETNQQLTAETTGLWDNMMDNGAVNLFNKKYTSGTQDGVTFTVDSNNIVTVVVSTSPSARKSISANVPLKAGNYRLTGCPSGGNNTNRYRIVGVINGAPVGADLGNGGSLILNSDATIDFRIDILAECPTGTYVFKPMLSDASLNLSYDDYVPYAMSNRELTEDLANMGLVSATPNKTTFNITYQGGKSGDMALVITSVGLGFLNFYASAWHWGGFIIASGTTITESNNSANGLTLTASGNIGLFLLPLNTEGDKWAITTN